MVGGIWLTFGLPGVAPQTTPIEVCPIVASTVEDGDEMPERTYPAPDLRPPDGPPVDTGWTSFDRERRTVGTPPGGLLEHIPDGSCSDRRDGPPGHQSRSVRSARFPPAPSQPFLLGSGRKIVSPGPVQRLRPTGITGRSGSQRCWPRPGQQPGAFGGGQSLGKRLQFGSGRGFPLQVHA